MMKIANVKKSVSQQLRINDNKCQLEHSHTVRSTKKKIKSKIPKWKLKNHFKTFDDLLVLIDTFDYLSDDEKNKRKFTNIRQYLMEGGNQKKQSSIPQQSENSKKQKVIVRKPTLDELQLVEKSQNDLIEDALQLEAFYFWLSQIGYCISPIFSLSPILSYYLYSILLFDFKKAKFLIQNDNQLIKIKRQLTERQQLINKIINYQIQKSDANQQQYYFEDYQAFLSIIPHNITFQDIDIDIIMDDFTLYSQQYIDYLKNGDGLQQIGKLLIPNQNNVVLGYIRFNFISEQAKNIKFRYPISKFDNDQCLDYFEIMERYNLLEKINQNYNQLMQFINSYHSEMAMLLWLIQDAINIQTIFNQLKQSFIHKEINDSQLILKSIQLDITSKNKICDDCVNMFNSFPTKFYCEQMLKRFKFKIKSELYLIINSQFCQDPQQKEGQQLYMEPTIIEVRDEQMKVIDEQQELVQNNPQQQLDQQQANISSGQHQNQIIQSNQQITQQEQQEQQQIIQFNSLQQSENITQRQEIKQQSNQGKQFVRQSEKISYYVLQIEQEITGLISKKMFDYRYRRNDIPIKKKLFQIPLENTFFISSCNEDDQLKFGLSIEVNQLFKEQKKPGQIKSEKSGKTCLFCNLQQIKEFKKIKEIQLEKIQFEQKIIEKRKNNITLQKQIDDFKTKFISSLTIYYCKQLNIKSFKKFKIDQLSYLIQYVVLQNDQAGQNIQLLFQIQPYFTDLGIIFNEQIDKRLLLKDYIFFKERVTPFNHQIEYFDKEINNQLAIQVFQFDNVQHSWSTLKLDNKYQKIINNCKEFFAVIQSTLQTVSQQGKFKYYLLICNLYEIDNKCKKYLVDQINKDQFINKLDITIHFESINLIVDKQNYKKQTTSFQQQQQSQIDIRFGQSNLLNVENFMNRYQQQNDYERSSFKDTQELIENFSCFNCQTHDKYIQQQTQKNQE